MKDKVLQIRVDEEFLSKLEYVKKIYGLKSFASVIRWVVEKEFRKEKAEDVLSVEHAHWIIKLNDRHRLLKILECSKCHEENHFFVEDERNYCPNCGARMDEVCDNSHEMII